MTAASGLYPYDKKKARSILDGNQGVGNGFQSHHPDGASLFRIVRALLRNIDFEIGSRLFRNVEAVVAPLGGGDEKNENLSVSISFSAFAKKAGRSILNGNERSGTRQMRKVRIPRVIAVFLIILIFAGGFWFWLSGRGKAPSDSLLIYGNVDIRQVELAFNASERIASMTVREGDIIKQGQLLATLETERLTYAVQRAEAQVRAQQENLAKLIAGSRPEEIRKARADVEAASAEARNAELTYSRFHLLAAKDLISKQDADNARAANESGSARLKAAKEALGLAVAGSRKEDIESARAVLKAAEAELASAKRDLSQASLYAPSDGIIQVRIMEPGDMASPQKACLYSCDQRPDLGALISPRAGIGKGPARHEGRCHNRQLSRQKIPGMDRLCFTDSPVHPQIG